MAVVVMGIAFYVVQLLLIVIDVMENISGDSVLIKTKKDLLWYAIPFIWIPYLIKHIWKRGRIGWESLK